MWKWYLFVSKNTLNGPVSCLQTKNSIFEDVFHSVNYDDFEIGKLNIIVNIFKLHVEDILYLYKKNILKTEIKGIKEIVNLFHSLNLLFIMHFYLLIWI